MVRGRFITFEGLDGSGKSTQLRKLAEWLQSEGRAVTVTRQPGGTVIGERIRALTLDSRTAGLDPYAELALMFADRAQAIREVVRPALEAGSIVLSDRFTDSTEAYQGGGRELGSDIVRELHKALCGNLQPDLTLLLLPDLSRSLERARSRMSRGDKDESRFEREAEPFYRRVSTKYREIAGREPDRVVAVEGELDIEAVHRRVIEAVQALFARTGQNP